MNVTGIRQGMATAAATVGGLRAVAYLRDAVNPPVFVAGEMDITYNRTFKGSGSGLVEALFTGRIYASRADERAGQELLDSYLTETGATSVKAAIEADRTLGGACKTLIVERVRGYGVYQVAATEYLGARFDIRVWG